MHLFTQVILLYCFCLCCSAQFWTLELYSKPHCDSTGFVLSSSGIAEGVGNCIHHLNIQSFLWLGEPDSVFHLLTFTSLDCSGDPESDIIGTPENICFTLLAGATPADSWIVIGI